MPVVNCFTATLLCSMILAGCALAAPAPTSTPTLIPTATATVTPTVLPCSPDNVLIQVDALLAGQTFQAHYLTINRQLVLSVWLVDAEIDPEAAADDIAGNNRKAFLRGASTAHAIAYHIPCAGQVFDGINPMVVDRDYNSWYIDIIPMRALPESEHPTDEELMRSIERSGMEIAYLRRTVPRQEEHAALHTCAWPEARDRMQVFFGEERRNAAAYLIVGQQTASRDRGFEPQVVVQAQWDIASTGELSEETVLAAIEQLASALSCLSPRLDRLEVFIVDAAGRLFIFGLVPGDVIYEDLSPIPADRVRLHYMDEPGE